MEFGVWLATEERLNDEYEQFVAYSRTYNPQTFKEMGIPSFLKDKFSFISNFAKLVKTSWENVIGFFQNRNIYQLFQKINWSLPNLWKIVKSGYDKYKSLVHLIHTAAHYIAGTKTAKFSEDQFAKIDRFISKHPIVAKITGPALAGLLLFIWMNQSHTGDLEHDFNIQNVIKAFNGEFSLADLFAGTSGAHSLILLATHTALHVTFPYPIEHLSLLAIALFHSLVKEYGGYGALSQSISQLPSKAFSTLNNMADKGNAWIDKNTPNLGQAMNTVSTKMFPPGGAGGVVPVETDRNPRPPAFS